MYAQWIAAHPTEPLDDARVEFVMVYDAMIWLAVHPRDKERHLEPAMVHWKLGDPIHGVYQSEELGDGLGLGSGAGDGLGLGSGAGDGVGGASKLPDAPPPPKSPPPPDLNGSGARVRLSGESVGGVHFWNGHTPGDGAGSPVTSGGSGDGRHPMRDSTRTR